MPAFPDKDLEALLLLSRTPGIRMRGIASFFEQGVSPAEILERLQSGGVANWKESLHATQKIFSPEKERDKAERLGIQILPFNHLHYPSLLRESSDPPLVLYVKGGLEDSDQASVALVGSRHPSVYGLEQARRFAERLAGWGLTIVSGFARGIDRTSHEGALEI